MPSLRPDAAMRDRLEVGRLQEHLRRVLAHAGILAAHDAADAMHALVVGDDGNAGIERVGLAVERQDLLAVAGLAHHQVAGDLLGIEHVQRPVEVEGHEVGDVDQGRDRTQADRLQPALQPVGRGAVLDAAEVAAEDDGAGAVGLGLVAVRPFDRAFVGAGDLVGLQRLQGAEPRRGEIAGDAVHAQAIGAVGRHLDLDHRIVEAQRLGRRRAGPGLGRQVDDAAMVVAELELA